MKSEPLTDGWLWNFILIKIIRPMQLKNFVKSIKRTNYCQTVIVGGVMIVVAHQWATTIILRRILLPIFVSTTHLTCFRIFFLQPLLPQVRLAFSFLSSHDLISCKHCILLLLIFPFSKFRPKKKIIKLQRWHRRLSQRFINRCFNINNIINNCIRWI